MRYQGSGATLPESAIIDDTDQHDMGNRAVSRSTLLQTPQRTEAVAAKTRNFGCCIHGVRLRCGLKSPYLPGEIYPVPGARCPVPGARSWPFRVENLICLIGGTSRPRRYDAAGSDLCDLGRIYSGCGNQVAEDGISNFSASPPGW